MTPAEFRAARKSLGLTGEEIAGYLGYGSKTRVSAVENAETVPTQTAIIMQYLLITPRDQWVKYP